MLIQFNPGRYYHVYQTLKNKIGNGNRLFSLCTIFVAQLTIYICVSNIVDYLGDSLGCATEDLGCTIDSLG